MFWILNVGDEVCAGAISFACINEESSFRKIAYHCGVLKHNDRIWRREVGEYHIFLARRLARLQHHHRGRRCLSRKKRKVKMGLEDRPTGEWYSKRDL